MTDGQHLTIVLRLASNADASRFIEQAVVPIPGVTLAAVAWGNALEKSSSAALPEESSRV